MRDVEQSLEESSAHRLYAVAKAPLGEGRRPVAVQVSSRRVSLLAASRAVRNSLPPSCVLEGTHVILSRSILRGGSERMTSNASEGRGLARSLVLVLGIAVLLGLAGALVGMRALAAQAPAGGAVRRRAAVTGGSGHRRSPGVQRLHYRRAERAPRAAPRGLGPGRGPPALSGPLSARLVRRPDPTQGGATRRER